MYTFISLAIFLLKSPTPIHKIHECKLLKTIFSSLWRHCHRISVVYFTYFQYLSEHPIINFWQLIKYWYVLTFELKTFSNKILEVHTCLIASGTTLIYTLLQASLADRIRRRKLCISMLMPLLFPSILSIFWCCWNHVFSIRAKLALFHSSITEHSSYFFITTVNPALYIYF